MKITKIDLLTVGGLDIISFTFCRVYTDAGIYGDGEVAGIHGSGHAAFAMLQDFAKYLIGKDPMKTELIWEDMFKTSFWGQNGGPAVFNAMSAYDIALWDIKGKYFNVPVSTLLGGASRDSIRCYASQLQDGWWPLDENGYSEPHTAITLAEIEQSCKQAVAEGFDCVKIDCLNYDAEGKRPTRPMREQMLEPGYLNLFKKRIECVRKAIGPDVQLIVENHSRLDSFGACQIAGIAKDYDILYFEEPNTPSAFTAEYLKEKIDIPLAMGERIYTRWQYIPYLENRTLRIIQPDISNCGGYTETKKVCDMAHAYDVGVQIHTCGSPLSTHIALQLEAVIPNFAIHEHHSLLRNIKYPITKYNWQPENGHLPVPTEPGIGNELTAKAWELAEAKMTIE